MNGTVYDYVTGSYFSPYVTTVGLYNNDQRINGSRKDGTATSYIQNY